MNDKETDIALANQNNIFQQLYKYDERTNAAIHDINLRLNSLSDEISRLRMDVETIKVKYDYITENCHNHVCTLNKHDDNMRSIIDGINEIKKNFELHNKEKDELVKRIDGIYAKLDSHSERIKPLEELKIKSFHYLEVVAKIAGGIVGIGGFLLLVQQIFFGNWHF